MNNEQLQAELNEALPVQEVQLTDDEILMRMLQERQGNQNLEVAKQEDKIEKYNSQINALKAEQRKQNELISTCNTIIESKAFPALDPLISHLSDRLSESNKNKSKKIKTIKKKIKNASKKIKKINRKKKRTDLLKSFIDSMLNPRSDKNDYINGMMALREDSLDRTQEKISKTSAEITKLATKLRSGELNNAQIIKVTNRLRTLQTNREKLEDKLNSLNGLGEQLKRLANYEMIAEKVEVLKNTSVENAEKAALRDDSISTIIDGQTDICAKSIDTVLNPEMRKAETENIDSSRTDNATEQAKEAENNRQEKNMNDTISDSKFMKISNIDEDGINKLFKAGVDFQTVTAKDGSRSVVFDAASLAKVKSVLSNVQQEKTQDKVVKRV